MAYPTVYGLWTNKGGVGKTTLTYHLATSYAELFPDKIVVAIDMCPQSNLSSTLLTQTTANNRAAGDILVKELHDSTPILNALPRTVGGFFMHYISEDTTQVPPEDWLLNVKENNLHMPDNLWLMCGDTCLVLMVDPLTRRAGGDVAARLNPYKVVHVKLRNYVQQLANYCRSQNKELVVFIDTNPALSIYTQIALVAATDLIIPVNADSFSMQAVHNMFHLLYGLYPSNGPAASFEANTFASKARAYGIPLPKIAAIVHNRTPAQRQAGNGQAQGPAAYRHLADSHAGLLLDGYLKAVQRNELERVFVPRANGPFAAGQLLAFSQAYTGTMRDMRSCGVAAIYTGLPIWILRQKASLVNREFKFRNFNTRAQNLMRDMLAFMSAVFGADVMTEAHPAALARLQQLAGANDNADSDDEVQGGGAGSGPDDDDSQGPGPVPVTPGVPAAGSRGRGRGRGASSRTNMQSPGENAGRGCGGSANGSTTKRARGG